MNDPRMRTTGCSWPIATIYVMQGEISDMPYGQHGSAERVRGRECDGGSSLASLVGRQRGRSPLARSSRRKYIELGIYPPSLVPPTALAARRSFKGSENMDMSKASTSLLSGASQKASLISSPLWRSS